MSRIRYQEMYCVHFSCGANSNSKTSRWLVFRLTCVCVCVCEKVCQWISYERVDRFRWKLRCMLQLASNRKPPLTRTIRSLLPLRSRFFSRFFEPLYLGNHKRYLKTKGTLSTYNFKIYKFDSVHFFDISNVETCWKKLFLEKFVKG